MCMHLTSFLPAVLVSHYEGVYDLKHLRAKDLVDCLYSLIILGTQIWNIFQQSSALFWTCIALNCFTCIDFFLRLISPNWSFIVTVANFFQRKLFPGPPESFPKTALIARLTILLLISVSSVVLKILVAENNPVQVIPNGALIILLAIEAYVHFCPGYVIYGIGIKLGLIPIPSVLKPGEYFHCSCLGPKIEQAYRPDDVLLVKTKADPNADEVQPIVALDIGDENTVNAASPTESERGSGPVSPSAAGQIFPKTADASSPTAWSN